MSPNGQFVYVGNWHGFSISVIQVSTNTVVATIPGVSYPEQIVVSPDGTRVFVVNLWANEDSSQPGSVTVIDAMANQIVTTIPLPDATAGMAITPNDGSLYVTELNLNEVIKISTVTYQVVATIPVGSRPTAIVVSPNGAAAYVADSALFGGTPDVEVIKLSTNKIIGSITVGTDPDVLAISANGASLYVTNQLSNTVSVVDTLDDTVVTIPVSTGPDGIAVKPAAHTACE